MPTAIITGAGRGIGRATAIELSRAGYRCLLVSRTEMELRETAGLCEGKQEIMAADVGEEPEVSAIVQRATAELGEVNAVIHCAGMAVLGQIDRLTAEGWRRTVDVNLSAIVHFARLLWPMWTKQGGGVMVNVSSFAARDPFAGLGAYGAVKAGVNLLGLALAREGKPVGIRVHTVAPAATETAMLRSLFNTEQVPEDKTMEPETVARVIVQCVKGDLAATSGEVIYLQK